LNLAPFAAILLIAAAAVDTTGRASQGFRLRVAELAPCGAADRRIVVLQALRAGKVKINVDPVSIDQLANKLEAIFKTRAERVAFVTAEAHVPFGSVAELIDAAATHVDSIALLPSLEFFSRPHAPVCPALVPIRKPRSKRERPRARE
jgi:biopolymer transport protein ExbD